MPSRHFSLELRRALIATLLLAWALTQTLGVVHRMLSGHAAPLQRTAASTAGPDAGFLHPLFAGHQDERDCKSFDQQAHADLAWGEAAACAVFPAGATLALDPPAGRFAADAALYRARGPPVPA